MSTFDGPVMYPVSMNPSYYQIFRSLYQGHDRHHQQETGVTETVVTVETGTGEEETASALARGTGMAVTKLKIKNFFVFLFLFFFPFFDSY